MSIGSELLSGFEQLAESLEARNSIADIADVRAEAAETERARCAGILQDKLAVCKHGMAAAILTEALAEIECKPTGKPVCSKHQLAGCPACKGAK